MKARYARVTFRGGPTQQAGSFVGFWSRPRPGILRGERKEDAGRTSDGKDGIRLCLAFVADDCVVSVERENPTYGTWEKAPDGWLEEVEVGV